MPRSRAPLATAILLASSPPSPQPQRFCMHPSRRPVALLAATVAALAVAIPSTALATPTSRSTRWRSTPSPADITTGPDGALWASGWQPRPPLARHHQGQGLLDRHGRGQRPRRRRHRPRRRPVGHRPRRQDPPRHDPRPDHHVPPPHRRLLPDLDRRRPRRRALVHRVARQPDRPHHDERQDHRVRDPDARAPAPPTSPSAPTARSGSPSRPPTRSAASPPPAS